MILDADLLQAVEEQIVLDARVIVERLRRGARPADDDQFDKDVADALQTVEPMPGRALTDEEINRLGLRARGWHLFAERGLRTRRRRADPYAPRSSRFTDTCADLHPGSCCAVASEGRPAPIAVFTRRCITIGVC